MPRPWRGSSKAIRTTGSGPTRGGRAQLAPIKRALIIQTGFLGDLILSTPLIRATKETFPSAELFFLSIPSVVGALAHNPNLTQVITYDKRGGDRGLKGFLRVKKKLREIRIDLALIPHRSLRSALFAIGAGIRERIGFDRSAGFFLLTKRVTYQWGIHEVERNLSLLSPLGVNPRPTPPELFPSAEEKKRAEKFLKERGISSQDRLVGFAPGSFWPTKRWPKERFAQLGRMIKDYGGKVILFSSSQEREICEVISSLIGGRAVVAASSFSLLESAWLLTKLRVLVANDTAPAHMASAMGTPVVVIFGPTVPEFGFGPWGQGEVIQRMLPCRPCSPHGPLRCPRGSWDCMLRIGAEEVFSYVIKYLRR